MKTHKLNRGRIVAGLAGVLVALAAVGTAPADVIGDCSLTGYTFMGGSGVYVSTPEGPNAKDYFRAQSLNWDYSGTNMWGYGWAKFENIATEPVESAYVVFDLLANGSMSDDPVTPEEPAELYLYDAGTIDVEDLEYGSDLLLELRDNLDEGGVVLDFLTMTSVGTYSIDITDLYNSWVTDGDSNHGVVFVAPDDGNGGKYASFDNADGVAPYVSTVPVPEPGTMGLLVCGAVGLFVRRRRSA